MSKFTHTLRQKGFGPPKKEIKEHFPHSVVAPSKPTHYLKDWPAYQWCVEQFGQPSSNYWHGANGRPGYEPGLRWLREGQIFHFKTTADATMFTVFFK